MVHKKNNKRRFIRRLAVVIFLGFAIAMTATVLYLTPIPTIVGDLDDRAISAERLKRWYTYRTGNALPHTPDLTNLKGRLAARRFKYGAPIFLRIFKRSFELEVWLKRGDRFYLFENYPICGYSGRLGPKYKEGDRQSPEGIYTVAKKQLNPNSRWHRSFNLGYPNSFDRTHGRTGSFLMVHGGCQSIGCYAMTDPVIDELWRLINAAFDNGQKSFQVQSFPFRLTDEALRNRKDHQHHEFWADLKVGHDLFEATGIPPRPSVCRGRYRFKPGQAGSNGSASVRNSCPQVTQTGR
ncbi:MAG: L,D-transpeptidase family protein [Hyphomicrobiaceae bacterium]